MEAIFQDLIPGARDVEHVTIRKAGHFLQETGGEEVAAKMIASMRAHGETT